MKTGFICASGFNLVATATRNNKHLIAVVLGAPSGTARAVKAAELLEQGFAQNPLSWLMPSLGTVNALQPVNADPPNLKDEMCGPHRKRPASDEDDEEAQSIDSAPAAGDSVQQFSTLLSALRAPTPKNVNLLTDLGPVTPVVVYTGPTRTPEQIAKLAAEPVGEPAKKKAKHKTATARASDEPAAEAAEDKPSAKPKEKKSAGPHKAIEKPVEGKPRDDKARNGKSASVPTSLSALAASAVADSKTDAPAAKKKPKPKSPAVKPSQPAQAD